ncbi:uncharacterized protein ACA1_385910, partial [Acanthamoeba castellanii str. Neff]
QIFDITITNTGQRPLNSSVLTFGLPVAGSTITQHLSKIWKNWLGPVVQLPPAAAERATMLTAALHPAAGEAEGCGEATMVGEAEGCGVATMVGEGPPTQLTETRRVVEIDHFSPSSSSKVPEFTFLNCGVVLIVLIYFAS